VQWTRSRPLAWPPAFGFAEIPFAVSQTAQVVSKRHFSQLILISLPNNFPGRARRGVLPGVPAPRISRRASACRPTEHAGLLRQLARVKIFFVPWRDFATANLFWEKKLMVG